jgi:hypothetical protein
MIANCRGCRYELEDAYRWVYFGFHIATAKGIELFGKGHLNVIIVNDKGKVIQW